jgi:hypothetical protein
MNCREWEEAIALYCGGDMDGQRGLAVERHLAACAACRSFAGGMRECTEEMRAGHREEIAAADFAAVRARVLAELLAEARAVAWWRRWWLQVGAVAAVAAVACCALWMETVNGRIRRPVAPQVARARRLPDGAASGPGSDLSRDLRAANRQVEEPAMAAPGVVRGVVRSGALPPRPRQAKRVEEPVLVRMVTDNPDVVIYWIASPKGE